MLGKLLNISSSLKNLGEKVQIHREAVFVFQDVVVMLKYHKALETCLVALRLHNNYDLKVNKLEMNFKPNKTERERERERARIFNSF